VGNQITDKLKHKYRNFADMEKNQLLEAGQFCQYVGYQLFYQGRFLIGINR
jgi:hypothetical protein